MKSTNLDDKQTLNITQNADKQEMRVSGIINLLSEEIDQLIDDDESERDESILLSHEQSQTQSITINDPLEPLDLDQSMRTSSYLSITNDDDSNQSINKKHKSQSSAILSDILSSSTNTIRNFQYSAEHDNIPSHPSSKAFELKQFLKKDNTAGTKLNELLLPATPTINQFQSNEDHKQFKLAVKQHTNSSKLAELLLPATPTIHSFQSNEDIPQFQFDGNTDDDIDYSDHEEDVDLLQIQLEDTIDADNNGVDVYCSNLKTCVAVKRLIYVLRCYQKIDSELIETIKTIESKHNISILNDYHHVLFHHLENNDQNVIKKEFEHIYKDMDFACDLHDCNKYQRHRERGRNHINTDKLNEDEEVVTDADTIYYTDLIDSIHCFLLHSYDTGMRSKHKKKTESPPKHVKKSTKILIDELKTENDNDNGNINNKYFTNMDHFDNFGKPKKKKQSSISFDFGYKYYYWDHYKDNEYFDSGPNAGYKKGDWFIHTKYDNLKQEILTNAIHKLSLKDFESAIQKTIQYLNCSIAKALQSDNGELSEFCQIKPGSAVTEQNLLSIVLYTDYTDLCYHFSSTFRKIDKHEQISEIKNRNSEYANWSKLLIETVELYGTSICNSNINVFYHGVSYMTFPSFLSYFCGPTSTTPQLEVAENFCGSKGLILELVKENEFSLLKYFNCAWIGAFTAEDEKLFIGGYRPLKFYSIRSMTTGDNYYHYIVSLTLFDYVLNGKKLSKRDKESKIYSKTNGQIIKNLMKHYDPTKEYENKYPSFVNDLFKTFADNKKQILIHLDAVNEDYPFMKSYLFSKKCINFLKLAKCFKNCVKITVYSGCDNDKNMSKVYLDELREILEELNKLSSKNKNVKISLNRIKLSDVKYNNEYLDDVFTRRYGLEFPFCKLRVDTQTRLQKQDEHSKMKAKKAKNLRDARRNAMRRQKSGKIKNVGFAVDEAFERVVIRSDLIINRSKTLLKQIEEASRAHTTVLPPPGPRSLREQTSDTATTGFSSNPSSQRPSLIYDSEESFLDMSRANMSTSRLFGRVSESGHVFNGAGTNRITEFNGIKDPSYLMAQLANARYDRDSQLQRLGKELSPPPPPKTQTPEYVQSNEMLKRLYTHHEEDHTDIDAMVIGDFLNNELTDASILGINNYTARKIWMESCFKSDKDVVKYSDLYPNLMEHFKKLTKCERRTPSKEQLQTFFVALKEEKRNDENDEFISMHSSDFDRFYQWFKSLCGIISDFKHIYDVSKTDVLIGLFYDKDRAEEILSNNEYKNGTFILRLSIEVNELFVSYKNKENDVRHSVLIRCDEDEIYQIGKSSKQLPISTFIRSCNLLQFLCIENNIVKNKNIYF